VANTPLTVDLPHSLGAEEARRRIAGGADNLKAHLPAGAKVRSAWTGDRLALQVFALGQEVNAGVEVHDPFVRVEILLPPALAFVRPLIEAGVRGGGKAMLEDRRQREG
jgi:hypothetical protein